jgi:hypothetical protein
MSDEFFQFIESPETATIRLNTDAMSHLGILFSSLDDTAMQQAVFDMLCKHSKFVLETSEKVVLNKRLGIKAIK